MGIQHLIGRLEYRSNHNGVAYVASMADEVFRFSHSSKSHVSHNSNASRSYRRLFRLLIIIDTVTTASCGQFLLSFLVIREVQIALHTTDFYDGKIKASGWSRIGRR
jgi:hypothetical protein